MIPLLYLSRAAASVMIGIVLVRLAPAGLRAFTKRAIHLDYFWLLFCGLTISRLIYQGRNLFFVDLPDEPGEAAFLIFANAITVLCMFGVLKAYGWYRHDP